MNRTDVFIFKADLADFKECSIAMKKQAVSEIARKFVINHISEVEGISSEKLNYSHNTHGKPYITNSQLHFNISHCGSVIAVAFSIQEIGTDIELVRDFNSAVVKRYFTSNEQEYIFSAQDKDSINQHFFEIWTAKEAFLKYCGVGISGGFDFDTASSDKLLSRINSTKLGSADVIHYNNSIFIDNNDLSVNKLNNDSDKLTEYCFSMCAHEINEITLQIL